MRGIFLLLAVIATAGCVTATIHDAWVPAGVFGLVASGFVAIDAGLSLMRGD